jgi:hypothetical protein
VTARVGLVFVAIAAGCTDGWPDLEPVSGDVTADPRLGTIIDQGTGQFRVASIFEDEGVVLLYEEDLVGWQALRLNPATLEVTTLPAPPLMPRETFMLGRAMAPVQTVIAIVRDSMISILVLDEGASSWRSVEGPPQITIVDPASFSQLLVHDDRIYAVIAGRIFVRTATGWTEPATSGNPFLLGGFDAQTQWVVTQPPNLPLTAIPIDAAGVAGTSVVGLDKVLPDASALNGNADQFQVIANAYSYVVTRTAITRVESQVDGVPFAAPGSTSVIIDRLGGRGGARRVEAGVVGENVLPAFTPDIGDKHLELMDIRMSPATDQAAIIIGTDLDGYAVLSVRILDLPSLTPPF